MSLTKISVSKTAKIATFGKPERARIAIIAFHGYGQLAQFFVRKFHGLQEDDYFVVVPEGLHRFYLEGNSGKVGASWMTKEERQDDIANNINYINLVYSKFIEAGKFEKIVVLGFSQGAATSARWLEQTEYQIDAFVQWAGVFPPDLNLDVSSAKFQKLKHFYVVGNQDPYFLNESHGQTQKSWLQENGLNPVFKSFDGAHQLESACLIEILQDI